MAYNKMRTGLVATHAYSVLNVKEVTSCVVPCSTVRIVQLRNPWGTGEWHGAFSDHSCYWSEEAKEACQLEAADDGAFWMSLADFRRYFAFISVAPFHVELAADAPQVQIQVMER